MLKHHDHLRGHKEYIFRQSMMGSVGHIALFDNATDVVASLQYGPPFPELRILTFCGKDLKYGESSNLTLREGSIRNACEYCFIEWYDPEDPIEHEDGYYEKGPDKVHYGNLPF